MYLILTGLEEYHMLLLWFGYLCLIWSHPFWTFSSRSKIHVQIDVTGGYQYSYSTNPTNGIAIWSSRSYFSVNANWFLSSHSSLQMVEIPQEMTPITLIRILHRLTVILLIHLCCQRIQRRCLHASFYCSLSKFSILLVTMLVTAASHTTWLPTPWNHAPSHTNCWMLIGGVTHFFEE